MDLVLGACDAKFVAVGASERFLDLSMTWESGTSSAIRISLNRVFATFAIQAAAVFFDVTDQVATLHGVGTSTVTVSQTAVAAALVVAFARYYPAVLNLFVDDCVFPLLSHHRSPSVSI
ncbi:MAG: hypothetical protein HYV60_16545 [Planctomycetia bacterium]|nr:hypothetical protein [Planctomycetia bacterium]